MKENYDQQNNFMLSLNKNYGHVWDEVIENLSVTDLEKLKKIFKSKNSGKGLNKEDFLNAIVDLSQEQDYSEKSIALFEQIRTNDNTTITWSDFLEFLMQNALPTIPNLLSLEVTNIITVPQTKREAIIKMVLIETEKYFCYAVVSKHGRIGLYDGSLNFLTSYQLIMTRADISMKEEDRRRRNRWVTDAIFCLDTLTFILTNTTRSIVIYDASGLKHVPLWLILSTPNIVQCFAYKNCFGERKESTLFMGDDNGMIISLTFLQPKVSLLRKKYSDKISLFYWDQLPEEKDFIIVKRIGRPHQESIKQIIYFEDNETLLSCSKDSDVSVIIKYIGLKNPPYVFKIANGCTCFALSRERKILVTGSGNGVLRLWNPIITAKPIAILRDHKAKVLDVKIITKPNYFMSCSSDGFFKLWSISEQKCVQSFTINFPSFSIFGKLIEWGQQCIYPGPKHEFSTCDMWERSPILVTCCNHIALVKMIYKNGKNEENTQILPPPPLQNSVLVPKMWKISNEIENKNEFESDSDEDVVIDPETLASRIKDLDFILKKDLFQYNEGSRSDINFKIATLERRKIDMQHYVALGAPYLALSLHEVNGLYLTPNLPVPNKKRIKNIAENVQKILEDASCRDAIFSEPSTSRSPRSSRSSIVEFEY